MHRQEHNSLSYNLQLNDGPCRLSCRFLESGQGYFTNAKAFSHPSPPFNRVFIFRQGGANIKTASRHYHLNPGHVYLLPINHSFNVHYHTNSELFYFHISLTDHLGRDLFHPLTAIQPLHDKTVSQRIIEQIFICYPATSLITTVHWQLPLLELLLAFVSQHAAAVLPPLNQPQEYTDLLNWIKQHLTASLTVDDVARHAGLSRSAMSKRFRRHLGIPLKTYMLNELLQKSRLMLAHTDKTVQAIAAELGYDDPYYFQRIFKKYTHHTPSAYRQALRRAPF